MPVALSNILFSRLYQTCHSSNNLRSNLLQASKLGSFPNQLREAGYDIFISMPERHGLVHHGLKTNNSWISIADILWRNWDKLIFGNEKLALWTRFANNGTRNVKFGFIDRGYDGDKNGVSFTEISIIFALPDDFSSKREHLPEFALLVYEISDIWREAKRRDCLLSTVNSSTYGALGRQLIRWTDTVC